MANKWDKIFEQRDCLTEKELDQYVSGMMSHDKKLEIEAHLNECDLCSDAVEGTQLMKSENKNSSTLRNVLFAIAASIIVFVVILNPFSDNEKNEILAENQSPKSNELLKKDLESKSLDAKTIEKKKTVASDSPADIVSSEDKSTDNSVSETTGNKKNEVELNVSSNSSASKSEESMLSDLYESEEQSADNHIGYEGVYSDSNKPEEKNTSEIFSSQEDEVLEETDDNESITTENFNLLEETENLDEPSISLKKQAETHDSVIYKKSIIPKKLNNGKKTYRRKELKEEEIDYDTLLTDYSGIQESDFEFDSLSPNERDSIGLILDEKQYEYEFSVGKELYEQKDYVKALEHLEKVIGSYGGNAYAIFLTAKSYQEIEKYEKAAKLYKALFETADVNITEKAFYNSAFCYWKLDNKKKAIRILDEMIATNSTLKKEAQELKSLIKND